MLANESLFPNFLGSLGLGIPNPFSFYKLPQTHRGPLMMKLLSFSAFETKTFLNNAAYAMQLHPHFGFDDGDLILQCDDVQFRVHYSQIFPRSKITQYYYRAFMGVIHPDGLLFAGNLKGGSEAWACLLAVIYHER
ncbi:hypothetical protein M422DRAFT_252568 [Sphaerobolus stellatus SS14]|uniref:Uncharacterized protein n=1 Tax=Sphaerobolus stellatus (strain SS14) TaxID=990650 RepID=A0A0C9VZS1_SPHS4|nr:hypothetical protein M422DRAFT_252568 [Sphaerobolus stellatus SS14]